MSPEAISNQSDLIRYLSASARANYLEGVGSEVRQASTLIKSYIIERHDNPESKSVGHIPWRGMRRVNSEEASVAALIAKDGTPFLYQHFDDRFYILHTTAKANITDVIIDRLVSGIHNSLDRAWLPSPFLLEQRTGQISGYRLSADAPESRGEATSKREDEWDPYLDDIENDDESDETRIGLHHFRVASASRFYAEHDLRRILSEHWYPHRMFAEWIQTRSVLDAGIRISSTTYATGKIISRTSSVEAHLDTARRLADNYRALVTTVENDFSIQWASHGEGSIRLGEALIMHFEGFSLIDLDAFVETVFDGRRPFNLLGIATKLTKSRIDVEAVDLHNGDAVSFEITHDWLRIYLPKPSCGNIVFRFVTNFQRFFCSSATLYSSSGEVIVGEAAL